MRVAEEWQTFDSFTLCDCPQANTRTAKLFDNNKSLTGITPDRTDGQVLVSKQQYEQLTSVRYIQRVSLHASMIGCPSVWHTYKAELPFVGDFVLEQQINGCMTFSQTKSKKMKRKSLTNNSFFFCQKIKHFQTNQGNKMYQRGTTSSKYTLQFKYEHLMVAEHVKDLCT